MAPCKEAHESDGPPSLFGQRAADAFHVLRLKRQIWGPPATSSPKNPRLPLLGYQNALCNALQEIPSPSLPLCNG